MPNRSPALHSLGAVLCPLFVLLMATLCASVLAYLVVSVLGDDVSYRTTYKRSSQLFLVLSIFPLMTVLKLNWRDLGFANHTLFFKQLVIGFCLGFITLLPVLLALVVLEVHVIDTSKPWTISWLGKKLFLELLLALLISLVEEPIFRGILLASLSKKMPIFWAIAVTTFYYASLHFVNSDIEIPALQVNALSGFILLQDAFAHLLNGYYLAPFFALCAVGAFLGLLRTQVKVSLGWCIGCHACWVWQIKLTKLLFNTNPKSDYLFLVSSYDGVIGLLVTAWLALTMIGYYFHRQFQKDI